MRILLVTATHAEADVIRRSSVRSDVNESYILGKTTIDILVTGVGSVATAWALTKWFSSGLKPDLALNAGIAGSYRKEINTGDVVMPVSDCFADAGIETEEGFMTLSESGLEDPDRFPFTGGRIIARNDFIKKTSVLVRTVSAVTVNTASGTAKTIEKIAAKYDPDIETMEGAAFFYICSAEKVPFIALRAISNKVEPRAREKWDIPLALDNLAVILEKVVLTFA